MGVESCELLSGSDTRKDVNSSSRPFFASFRRSERSFDLYNINTTMSSFDEEKHGGERVEDLKPVQTLITPDEIQNLSNEHREYLLQKHGTLELDPVPDMSDADPYNWSTTQVSRLLVTRRLTQLGAV